MSLTTRVTDITATIAVATAANTALLGTAHAYIDPGTGTMLLQVAGAMIAAGLFYLRTARLWIARHLGFGKANSEQPRADENHDSDAH
jgi:hypothetical protein